MPNQYKKKSMPLKDLSLISESLTSWLLANVRLRTVWIELSFVNCTENRCKNSWESLWIYAPVSRLKLSRSMYWSETTAACFQVLKFTAQALGIPDFYCTFAWASKTCFESKATVCCWKDSRWYGVCSRWDIIKEQRGGNEIQTKYSSVILQGH